ncbi:MAG TPA: aminodeoxychorismate synthase component I [Candidatus Avamphibacillus intestinigallinarum]|nr:aminodeoxychorismate synthase component I [Candidatus Avamphibacillus intestinigallinarum]
MKTLLIDNYDSYTYNLFQLLARINGEPPTVVKNDAPDWDISTLKQYDNVVISPGPGHPANEADFGICEQVLRKAECPILGVCLGHQGMATVFGGDVIHADEAIHGRRSAIVHEDCDVFANIPQQFQVVRYHSLVVDPDTLPEVLKPTAWTAEGHIMGLRHTEKPIYGVQFHPESISTEYGAEMLTNFHRLTKQAHGETARTDIPTDVACDEGRNQYQTQSEYVVHVRKLPHICEPEDVFYTLYREEPYAFWLDSSRREEGMSRFSFMGAHNGPHSEVLRYDVNHNMLEIEKHGQVDTRHESIFNYMQEKLAALRIDTDVPFDFNTGFAGYFGYELKAESGGELAHKAETPDAYFILADRLLVFDHMTEEMYILELTEASETPSWLDGMEAQLQDIKKTNIEHKPIALTELTYQLSRNSSEYVEDIKRIQQEIKDGETYEITLTNEIRTSLEMDGFSLYQTLREVNPAPYAAYLKFGDIEVLSSSPERFLKVDRNRKVSAKPIKGTIRRGKSEAEDVALLNELKHSEKNRAENLMIVDLLRNDLGVVCEIDSVRVPKLMDVESYETVHQLVSTVTGNLRHDVSVPELVRSSFAGGSMTGAPKKRSMQLIDEIENRARGIYSGSIGFVAANGTADLNIVIRTIVKLHDELSIGVGGAITMLSDAEEEYEEMLLKAEALIQAIQQATNLPSEV